MGNALPWLVCARQWEKDETSGGGGRRGGERTLSPLISFHRTPPTKSLEHATMGATISMDVKQKFSRVQLSNTLTKIKTENPQNFLTAKKHTNIPSKLQESYF